MPVRPLSRKLSGRTEVRWNSSTGTSARGGGEAVSARGAGKVGFVVPRSLAQLEDLNRTVTERLLLILNRPATTRTTRLYELSTLSDFLTADFASTDRSSVSSLKLRPHHLQ